MSTDSSHYALEAAVSPEYWVDRYGDYLFRFALSRLRDESEAEEIVQETFLKGIRSQHQFTGRGSQRGWLMSILKRKIIDFMRARAREQNRRPQIDDFDPTALLFDIDGRWKPGVLPTFTAEQELQSDEFWNVVRECLASIPQRQADVFVLSVLDEMDSDKICQELDITPSNMWVRLHRARLGLAKCVGSKWLETGREQIDE